MELIQPCRALFVFALIAGSIGCASTTVRQSAALADAGIAYGMAGKEVVGVTRDRYLDWKSIALAAELTTEPLCKPEEVAREAGRSATCKQAMEAFEAETKKDQDFVDQLAILAAHADALGRYFSALKKMAAYGAKGGATDATKILIDRINALNPRIQSDAKITDDQRAAWSNLAGLVGDSIKSGMLRETLRRDAEVIGQAIDLQGDALAFHVSTLEGIDKGNRAYDYARNVKVAYLTSTASSDTNAWIARRRAAILPAPEVAQLQKLKLASESLKLVWSGILEGRADLHAAEEVLMDVAGALKTLDDARRANADEN